MWCPYCGYEMREGHVRLRGQWAAWAGVLAVNFETVDGSGEGSEMLPRTLFRSHPRAAHCCVRCEAVLVEPKSGDYVPPPADAAAAAAGPVAAEAGADDGGDGTAAEDHDTTDAGEGEGSEPEAGAGHGGPAVAAEGDVTGNGASNGNARGADRGS